jgi:SAM-dependent methyltransferase
VLAIDSSPAYVAHARAKVAEGRATFEVSDAVRLPGPDAAFDLAVSGLVLNFIASPQNAVAEMARVTRPEGTLGAYVWDYAGEMQLMRHFWNAVVELDPAAEALDEGRRFPICNPEALVELFQSAALANVTVWPIDIPTRFRNFDDYWTPFLGGQGPAPGYVATLNDSRQSALCEHIRARLPIAPDGSIDLHARAWAVRGVRRT